MCERRLGVSRAAMARTTISRAPDSVDGPSGGERLTAKDIGNDGLTYQSPICDSYDQ